MSVDTLVYQLEDEDATVRLHTLQKLRKIAAVENCVFPVHNPRRFLHCVRRRIQDQEEPSVIHEALALLVDVMRVLGEDLDQMLTFILPYLMCFLPQQLVEQDISNPSPSIRQLPVNDQVYQVFREFARVSNNLKSIVELLVSHGMVHASAEIREASIYTIMKLVQDKLGQSSSVSNSINHLRVDKKSHWIELVQALIVTLEDTDEFVTIASEETLATVQLFCFGDRHQFNEFTKQYLNSDDQLILQQHDAAIQQFAKAAADAFRTPHGSAANTTVVAPSTVNGGTSGAILTTDTVDPSQEQELSSTSVPTNPEDQPIIMASPRHATVPSSPSHRLEVHHNVLLPTDVMDNMAASPIPSSSNADWKKRFAAAEKLFYHWRMAPVEIHHANAESIQQFYVVLGRLFQDSDPLIIKRTLQVLQLLLKRLASLSPSSSPGAHTQLTHQLFELLPILVETCANHSQEDREVEIMMASLWTDMFQLNADSNTVAMIWQILRPSWAHRRLQIRQEALKCLIYLLLVVQNDPEEMILLRNEVTYESGTSPSPSPSMVVSLARLCGDSSMKVRVMAVEVVALISFLTKTDFVRRLQKQMDPTTLQKVDFELLYNRLSLNKLPYLGEDGLVCIVDVASTGPPPAESDAEMLLQPSIKPQHTSAYSNAPAPVTSNPTTSSVSTAYQVETRPWRSASEVSATNTSDLDGISRGSTILSARSFQPTAPSMPSPSIAPSPAHTTSTVDSQQIANKLTMLKKKTQQMKKSNSSKRVLTPKDQESSQRSHTAEQSSNSSRQSSFGERSDASDAAVGQNAPHPPNCQRYSNEEPRQVVQPSRTIDKAPRRDQECAPNEDEQRIEPRRYQQQNPTRSFHECGDPRRRVVPTGEHGDPTDQEEDELAPMQPARKHSQSDTRQTTQTERPGRRQQGFDNEEDDSYSQDRRSQYREEASYEDRPIRPMEKPWETYDQPAQRYLDRESPIDEPEADQDVNSDDRQQPPKPRTLSLATRKRLEAKQQKTRQASTTVRPSASDPDQGDPNDDEDEDDHYWAELPNRPSQRSNERYYHDRLDADQEDDEEDMVMTSGRISNSTLALSEGRRKRLEKKKQQQQQQDQHESSREKSSSHPKSAFAKQETYLRLDELLPVPNLKQELTSLPAKLRSDNWEQVFDALNLVRRLALHHAEVIHDKIHLITTEILKQVPNLRSSVSKNALLALDGMCCALKKHMDNEVDTIIPVLIRRCADTNGFVCDSASSSINSVIINCSFARVLNALAFHANARAVAIRKEIPRGMHLLVVTHADQLQQNPVVAKDLLPRVLQVLGKCLEDPSNEVRNQAKQAVLFLVYKQQFDLGYLKRYMPSSCHSRVDQLLASPERYKPMKNESVMELINSSPSQGVTTTSPTIAASTKPTENGTIKRPSSSSTAIKRNSKSNAPPVESRTNSADWDTLEALLRRLDSNNWKDRFDALTDTTQFVESNAIALCESGRILRLFDFLVKRMEDGNARVNVLALESLNRMIPALGNGMEQVLANVAPSLAKNLASSNAKVAQLAQNVFQALCANVEVKHLSPHFAAIARHANSRIKPILIDLLASIASSCDDKGISAMNRYVVPLALELMKEAKSDVREANNKLLRALHRLLGGAMLTAVYKLSESQQDRFAAIVGIAL